MDSFQHSANAYDIPSYTPMSPRARDWSPIYPEDSASNIGPAAVGGRGGVTQEVQGGLLRGPSIGGAINPFELAERRVIAQGGERDVSYGSSFSPSTSAQPACQPAPVYPRDPSSPAASPPRISAQPLFGATQTDQAVPISPNPSTYDIVYQAPKARTFVPYSPAEDRFILDMVNRVGRKWAQIAQELKKAGHPARQAVNISHHYDTLFRAAQRKAREAEKSATPAERSWTTKEDELLLHLDRSVSTSSSVSNAATASIDWTVVQPYFLGRSIEELKKRLTQLKTDAKKADEAKKRKKESERRTREALEAFKTSTGDQASARYEPYKRQEAAPAAQAPPTATSSFTALPSPAPSHQSSLSTSSLAPAMDPPPHSLPPRYTFTLQGRPLPSFLPQSHIDPSLSTNHAQPTSSHPYSAGHASPSTALHPFDNALASPSASVDIQRSSSSTQIFRPPPPHAADEPTPARKTSNCLISLDGPPPFPRNEQLAKPHPFHWCTPKAVSRNLKRIARELGREEEEEE